MDPRTLRKSNRDSKWVQKPLWVFRVFLESNPHPNFARWPCDRDRCLTPWPELATLGINAASNLSFENCQSCLFCAKPWELSILNLVLAAAENLQELPCRNLNAWLSYFTIQKGLFSWQAHPSQPAEICYSILDPKLKCRRRNKVWISWILMFSMHSETAKICNCFTGNATMRLEKLEFCSLFSFSFLSFIFILNLLRVQSRIGN